MNTKNVRLSRKFRRHLEGARGLQEATIDYKLRAIKTFEAFTGERDFTKFRASDAENFKRHLLGGKDGTGKSRASLATIAAKLQPLRDFFLWLSEQPGCRSHINRNDVEFFNLSLRDQRVSRQAADRPYATPEQLFHVINTMPSETEIEQRNRALMALLLLTGARVMAVTTLKLKHVMPCETGILQDGSEVHTKLGKTFDTYFLPFEDLRNIFSRWVAYLRNDLLWGYEDPLFPKTRLAKGVFRPDGFVREHWKDSGSVRRIWEKAFAEAGVLYCPPHTVRKTVVAWCKPRMRTIEELQAVSDNIGHDAIGTTIRHYGAMTKERRSDLISGLGA